MKLSLLVIIYAGGLVACNGNNDANSLSKEMNEFAETYGVQVCTSGLVNTVPRVPLDGEYVPYGYQDETSDCVLDGEPVVMVTENTASPGRGLFKDIYIVFCLGAGVDANEDCWIGSRVQGYQRKKLAGETEWDYIYDDEYGGYWGYAPDIRWDDPSGGGGRRRLQWNFVEF